MFGHRESSSPATRHTRVANLGRVMPLSSKDLRLSSVAARSERCADIRGLRVEPTDDPTLGARWDPLLLTGLPSVVEDGHGRSEGRSS